MITIYYKHKKIGKISLKKFFKNLVTLIFVLFMAVMFLDLFVHPEKYSTTYKYQLQNELEAGKPEAVTYYNKKYKSKGINLFGKSDVINMDDITGFEATESGLYIYLQDGSGYYWSNTDNN